LFAGILRLGDWGVSAHVIPHIRAVFAHRNRLWREFREGVTEREICWG
jgi:hypothetical protein